MLTFEEFEKLPEDATIYVADVGVHSFEKAELHVRDLSAITCQNKTARNQKLYKDDLLLPWRNCFLIPEEAFTVAGQRMEEVGMQFPRTVINNIGESFRNSRKEAVIPKDTTISQGSMCGVPYAPPRTIHLSKEVCKKIVSGKMTKLIENFPRLPLDYELAVEGEEESFATIQVLSSERFDLPDRVADLKSLTEAVWDSRGEVTLSGGDDLAFCRSCGFNSIEDFVKHYENAPSCYYYLHTINLLNTY